MPTPPEEIRDLDGLAAALRAARGHAGAPSYTELAAAVRQRRMARGVPRHEATVGRVTVYDCFRDGRRRVDEDLVVDLLAVLGIPPGQLEGWRAALRRLHSAGAGRAPDGVVTAPATVTEVAPPAGTIGRELELAATSRLLADPAVRVVAIDGMAGVGKSHLARAVMARHARASGRPCLEVGLCGHAAIGEPASAVDVAVALLLSLGRQPGDAPFDQLEEEATRRGLLLLLDDAHDAKQVRPLLPRGGSWQVVVTSRRRLDVPDPHRVVLRPLSVDAAADLLRHAAPTTTGETPGWLALGKVSGGVPMAARLLASRLSSLPGWSPGDLAAATKAGPPEDVAALITSSLADLDPADQRALHMLCLHPTPRLSTAAAAALAGAEVAESAHRLERLAAHHLLDPLDDGQGWRVHDLVWQVGLERVHSTERPSDVAAARRRLLRHYLTGTGRAVLVLQPPARAALPWWVEDEPEEAIPSAEEAAAWLGVNAAAAQAALAEAETEDGVLVMHLAEVLVWHLVTHAASDAMLTVGLVARDVAARVGDLSDRARVERLMGNAYARLSRLRDADLSYRASRELAVAAGDVEAEIAAIANLARIASAEGDQDRATALLEVARAHYAQVGDGARESLCLTNLIVTHTRAGRVEVAADLSIEAAETARLRGWLSRELMALSNSIEPLLAAGRVDFAAEHVDRETVLAAELDDEVVGVYAVLHRAMVEHARGRSEAARLLAEEALAGNATVEDAIQRSQVLNQCGLLAAACSDPASARRYHEEALALALSIGESTEVARARSALGR